MRIWQLDHPILARMSRPATLEKQQQSPRLTEMHKSLRKTAIMRNQEIRADSEQARQTNSENNARHSGSGMVNPTKTFEEPISWDDRSMVKMKPR